MAFSYYTAADTLASVIRELSAAWLILAPSAQSAVEEEVMTWGPRIAAADKAAAPGVIVQLLDALWALSAALPSGVVQALQAGQVAPPPALRSLPMLSDKKRRELLDALVVIADFRFFEDPPMTAEALAHLVDAHRDRLTDVERLGWDALHDAFSRGGDVSAPLRMAGKLLSEYGAVRRLLDTRRTFAAPRQVAWRGLESMDGGGGGAQAHAPRPEMAMAAGDAGEDLVRFANIYFPRTVLVTQQNVPLIVHVAQQHATESVFTPDEARMALKIGDLTIVVHAEGFEISASLGGQPAAGNAKGRVVKVMGEADCEPAVFLLTPQSAGEKRINVYIDQFGRNILTRMFRVTVAADLAAVSDLANVDDGPVAVESPTGAEASLAPDLEMRVMLSADRRRLSFMLHGGEVYNFQFVGETDPLPDDPRVFLQPILDRLSTLARRSAEARSPAETAAAKTELSNLGADLFDKLFPAELKREYGETIRGRFAGKSLLITSDEPWFPWEVLRPFAVDKNGQILYDDPPLCEMFRLSRWLPGRGAPDQVTMKQGVWVAPPDNLQAAQSESDFFVELHRRDWDIVLSGPLTSVADVQARFQGRITQLYHFACHGNFDATNPDNSMIKLEGGFLSPSLIDVRARAGLLAAKPVVFLNACHAGQVGFSLMGLGGWAQKLLDSGASAFVGSLWEINDKLAAQFAREFYSRLWGLGAFEGKRQRLGQAFHEARLAIKAVDEANPTWMAYVLYGDPQGQVWLGKNA